PTQRQCRDVVNRLVGIQLGALPAGVLERVDDVRTDAEQPQLEYLEQPAGSSADDDALGGDWRIGAIGGGGFVQGVTFAGWGGRQRIVEGPRGRRSGTPAGCNGCTVVAVPEKSRLLVAG